MNRNVDVEVIVVGAGAAGLAAARLLAESGKTVRILEARDRIGGRIFTQNVTLAEGELAVELGAEFIHGLPAVSWDMVREAALATYELDGEMFCFEHGRLRPCEPQQHDSFALLRQMADWLQCHTPPADLSFDDYVQAARIDSGSAARAARYVEGFNAADRRIISATALVRQQQAEDAMEGDRIFHIRRGYDALPHYLAQRVQHAGGHFALRSWVEQISWRPGAVTVRGRCEGHDFLMRAEQAVIALPLGVLQSEGIRFDPAPAQAVRSWQSLAMGDVNRISLVFDRPFWIERARNLSFLFAPEEIFPTWWTSAPETAPTIVGWAGGAINFARSQIAVARGRTELRSAALQSLARIFDIPVGDLSAWLRGVHHHDWHADPYARGAYSYVPAGAVAAARQLSQPLEDTLYFAGEHTDLADQWGTVHGALASGIRAARHVLKIP